MPSTDITLTITTPADMPIADAVRLFTDHHNWTAEQGTRGAFAKATIARQVREAIHAQRKLEAAEAAKEDVPDDIDAE